MADELDLYDDKVQEGISWAMRQWGEALGLTTWTQGDGSESVEGDVGAEIHTILVDAGLRCPETNAMATLAAPMEAVAWREKVIEAVVARAGRRAAVTAGVDEALAVIPTQGLDSFSQAKIPTEWSERPEVVLQYAQQVATYAAKRVGCVDEWRPLEDVYGCLTQIDNCLTGLVAKKGEENQ